MTRAWLVTLVLSLTFCFTASWPAWSQQDVNLQNQYKIARSLAEQGRWDEAKEQIAKVIKLDKNYLDAWYLQGVITKETGDFELSVGSFKKVIATVPNFLQSYLLLAEAHAGAGDFDKAKEVLLQLKALPKGDAPSLYGQGVLAYKQGDLKEAENFWKRCLNVNTGYQSAYYNLSQLAWLKGDLDGAQDQIAKALRYDKERPHYVLQAYLVARELKQKEMALGYLYDLEQNFAKEATYQWVVRAFRAYDEGKLELAQKELKKAFDSEHRLTVLLWYQGLWWWDAEQTDKAFASWSMMLDKDPQSRSLFREREETLKQLDQWIAQQDPESEAFTEATPDPEVPSVAPEAIPDSEAPSVDSDATPDTSQESQEPASDKKESSK